MLLQVAVCVPVVGSGSEASRLLRFIERRCGREGHDFATRAGHKSHNEAFNEYRSYPNGWIAMAAQRMGRFDVAYPAFAYLLSFLCPDLGGFLTGKAQGPGEGGTDVFTTAHLGFLLRLDRSGDLVRDFPEAAGAFHVVRVREPRQAYFMIGYPMAFLAKLFQATGDIAHLEAARGYFDFALGCGGNLRSFFFSHKVGWGAAVLARITGDRRCSELATAIADHLLEIQIRAAPGSPTSRRTPRSIRPPRSPSGSRRSVPSWRGAGREPL